MNDQPDQFPTCPVHPGTLLLRRTAGGWRCIECTNDAGQPKSPAVEPWEALARERKATRIVDVIERLCPMTADDAEELDEDGCRAAAHLARVRPASAATWALVVERLREHEALGRQVAG